MFAQGLAQLAVDVEGFGEVALGCEGFHDVAIPAFPERCKADELSPGSSRAGQFGAAHAEFGRCVAVEGSDANVGELTADLVKPGGVLTR